MRVLVRLMGLLGAIAVTSMVNAQSVDDAAAARECPPLSVANSRLQARALVLLERLPHTRATSDEENRSLSADAGNLAVALANIIAARAKEEARIWLMQQLTDDVCESRSKGYFTNACSSLSGEGRYPGPSLQLLATQLRRDIYALPGCYGYKLSEKAPAGRAPLTVDAQIDEPIDAYVLEAALVGIYSYATEGSPVSANLPQLSSAQEKNVLARLVVAAAFSRLLGPAEGQPITFTRLLPGQNMQWTTATCNVPSIDKLQAVALSLEGLLMRGNPKATPEEILNALLRELSGVCKPLVEDLSVLAAVYATAVRGDYVEAALSAADVFLCRRADGAAVELCPRLPLLGVVAAAMSQEEMEAALDRVISPLGAWKRKQSERVFALNSMLGVAGGYEELRGDGDSARNSTYGAYLPIGLEMSWPLSNKRIGAIAAGASILDLGAIVSYSDKGGLEGGETSSKANSDWSSLTSPGIYVAVAFKDSPFRAGISLSRTPGLRSVAFDGGVEKDVDSTRLMLFFAVDVTLFSF